MAYDSNELYESGSVWPVVGLRVIPTSIQPKTLAPGSGTLSRLTPLGYSVSQDKWVVFDPSDTSDGTDEIKGFLWPDEATLDAADDVLANVLLAGIVHYDDIPIPAGVAENDLKAALREGPRALGLTIQGLENVR